MLHPAASGAPGRADGLSHHDADHGTELELHGAAGRQRHGRLLREPHQLPDHQAHQRADFASAGQRQGRAGSRRVARDLPQPHALRLHGGVRHYSCRCAEPQRCSPPAGRARRGGLTNGASGECAQGWCSTPRASAARRQPAPPAGTSSSGHGHHTATCV
eukprot:scaffold1942_cov351-Prasinococcus_capsulatus_cf.AAC.10